MGRNNLDHNCSFRLNKNDWDKFVTICSINHANPGVILRNFVLATIKDEDEHQEVYGRLIDEAVADAKI